MPVNPHMSPWTDMKVALLRDACEAKKSCSLIADELGMTRNAVIGKVHRLGLPKRKEITARPRRRIEREPAEKRIRFKARRAIEQQFPLFDLAPSPEFLGIPFVETTDKTCMYPEGMGSNMLFCGQQRAEHSSYCAGHHLRCFYTPERPVSMWRAA